MTALGESLKRFFERGPERTQRLNEGLSEALRYYLGPTGMDKRLALAAEMNPVQDVYQAGADMRDGNYAGAAVNTAAALMPTIGAKVAGGGLADDAANVISDTLTNVGTKAQGAMNAGQAFAADEFGGVGPSKGIRAYHGSPHDFDRFSMDAIGTGEGAQAYGHGLYFAENEGVARGYRDALTGRIDVQPVQIDGVRYNPPTEQHQRVAAIIAKDGRRNAFATFRDLQRQDLLEPEQEAIWSELLKSTKGKDVQPLQGGRMYEVNINANPDDFLDWDAPLSEQPNVAARLGFRSRSPDAVMDEMDALIAKHGDYEDMTPELKTRMESLQAELNKSISNQTGERVYNFGNDLDFISQQVTGRGPDPDRAATLRDAGIPGIKYKDAGSRGLDGAEGTRNFVVFDENLIEIVRKYGIAGAAALTGMTAAEVEAAIAE